jgi:hypothetical protein
MIETTFADAAIVLAGLVGTALVIAAAGWASRN